jgi:uncharacterized protein YqjF (DUF2071 family)
MDINGQPPVVRPFVPHSLAIDTYEGQAFVGLIPFVVAAARPPGAPSGLGLRFLETNVRTYVRTPRGEPGIFFFSLDAASLLAVAGARLAFGLPYFWAAGREHASRRSVDYLLRRRSGVRPVIRVNYQVSDALGSAAQGSLEHFLIERYRFHQLRGRFLWTVDVADQPYWLYRAHLSALREELMCASGIYVPNSPTLVHFSPGVDMQVLAPGIRMLK